MWPFTKKPPTERPLKRRLSGHVIGDKALRDALSGFGGIPSGFEMREESPGHVVVPFRFGSQHLRLDCWCPVDCREEAMDAKRTRELLTELGVGFPRVLHSDFSDESAARTGVWCLLAVEPPGSPCTAEQLSDGELPRLLSRLLKTLHSRTSTGAGRPWRSENPHQPWSRWAARRIESHLQSLLAEEPGRSGGIAWLRERFEARRQPDEVYTPFSLTLGEGIASGLSLTNEGELLVRRPEALHFAPFEWDLAHLTLGLASDRAESLIESHLAEHGPRERRRVHLNLGPLRAFAALERAHEPGGWERLLRVAEQDL